MYGHPRRQQMPRSPALHIIRSIGVTSGAVGNQFGSGEKAARALGWGAYLVGARKAQEGGNSATTDCLRAVWTSLLPRKQTASQSSYHALFYLCFTQRYPQSRPSRVKTGRRDHPMVFVRPGELRMPNGRSSTLTGPMGEFLLKKRRCAIQTACRYRLKQW